MQLHKGRLTRALFVLAGLAQLSSLATAAVLVNPPDPYPQHKLGDTSYSIYFGGSSTGTPYNSGYYNGTENYRFINSTASDEANRIWLDVSSSNKFTVNANQHIVVTISANSTVGSEVPIYGAGIVNTNVAPPACNINGTQSCQGTHSGSPNLYSAYYQTGTVLRLSFSVEAICSAQGASSSSLCATTGTNYSNMAGNTLTIPLTVTFSVVSDYTSVGSVGGANTDALTFTFGVTDIPPTITCPTGSIGDYYFPGDGQVYVTPEKYGRGVGAGALATDVGVSLKSLLFNASRAASGFPLNSISSDTVPSNEVIAYVLEGSGQQAVTGFKNSTNGNDNVYQAEVYAQNIVGLFSTTSCVIPFPYVKAQTIQGVLTESKCFIATAAYQDGRAAPVQMLRRFRDQVLAKTSWGRKFIQSYYRVSPALAEWAWDKPIVRSFALRALAPVELFAWTILKISQAEEGSPQPYIDRIKKNLDEGTPEQKSGEGYIDQEIKKLGPEPTPSNETYIDRLKKTIPEESSPEGYVDQQRLSLPEEAKRESPIEAVKAGRNPNLEPERPTIKTATGFKLGVNPGMVVANSGGTVSFDSMYGSGWQPDFLMHFEHQFFHSENFGSLGAGVDLGFSYAEGFGFLSFPFDGTNISKTKFTFIQVPLLFNAYYRFNLLRLIRPYVGGGVGSILFTEVRGDDAGDKRGYAFVYTGSAGVSLALDFLDSKTALDAYLSRGIQHSYWFAEFMYLNSFKRTGVYFERAGIYSGFLFEI